MTRFRGPITATAAVALLLLSACARPDGEAAAATVPAGSGPGGDLVLQVRQEGGFVPPERIPGRLPLVSVYADGRMITEGAVPAVYPGPALPNLLVHTLTPAQVGDLVDRAVAAGVRPGQDLGRPNVADAPDTRIDVVTDTGPVSVTAVALREAAPDDPNLTTGQRAARAKLAAFVDGLTVPPDTGQRPYRPRVLAALAQRYDRPDDGLPAQPAPVAWPGPALPGDRLSPTVDLGCVTVAGRKLDELLTTLRAAHQNTPWTSAGGTWRLTVRPLLPHESGCADLAGAR